MPITCLNSLSKKWHLIRSNRPLKSKTQFIFILKIFKAFFSPSVSVSLRCSDKQPNILTYKNQHLFLAPFTWRLWHLWALKASTCLPILGRELKEQQNLRHTVFLLQRAGSREAKVNLTIVWKASAQTQQTSHPQSSRWQIMSQGQASEAETYVPRTLRQVAWQWAGM